MSAGIRCDYCGGAMAADDVYSPVPGGAQRRCKDTEACGRRMLRANDPTIVPDEELPQAPAAATPAGAECAICGTADESLYERVPRSGQYVCRDRDGCQQRSIDPLYLTAWRDSSPDRLISSAEMMHATRAAGANPVAADETRAARDALWQLSGLTSA